jgi:anaerobic selenocysteine-containing dehydrogenase/Fe-S-cluster-containing dehydrogenase component
MSKMSRRTFLWFAGGSSFAIASNQPRKLVNKLIPQVIPPDYIRPGEWEFFATTCRECPAGCGMHLWYRDGRVTKAEGNPAHPVNRGGLCARGQSALQGLYDPDRLQKVLHGVNGKRSEATWEQALQDISAKIAAGGRVALLSSLQTGALAEVMTGFAGAFGSNRLRFYEAFNYQPLREAHRQLFGKAVIPSYDLEHSDFILSFGADFLETWISPVSYAYQFSNMHAYRGTSHMNRMAYVGPRLSMTAGNADIFLNVPPGQERSVAANLLKIIIDNRWYRNDISRFRADIETLVAASGPVQGVTQQGLTELARHFSSCRTPVALAGPVGAHGDVATDTALCAMLLNYAAGSIGSVVDFSHPHALSDSAMDQELDGFLASLGPEDVLLVHETNPAYSRPGAAAQIAKAGTVVYLGTLLDETAELAHWVLPVDSHLEQWGEYQPTPGVMGLMQPTMGRLYDTRSPGDILLELARHAGRPLARGGGAAPADFAAWLRARWSGLGRGSAEAAQQFWTDSLRNGGAWRSAPEKGGAAPAPAAVKFSPPHPPAPVPADQVELWTWGSIMLFDGRVANRGWLQEAPDPTTFIVWGNWIDLHPRKAAALGLKEGDYAELTAAGGAVRAPVRVSEDVTEQTAAIALGQGHRAMGRNARGIGANAFLLLGNPAAATTFGSARIRRLERLPNLLTRTTISRDQDGRDILQYALLSEISQKRPGQGDQLTMPLPEGYRNDKDMYPKRDYTKHRWAMVIDLQRCVGCGACAVACYAENNIPVIGKVKVGSGREMAWLRVPPYRKPNSHHFNWLPLPCQHCDAAPCEPVCPVFAAVHNEEGLNAQIYNRCIGTRYCSNNCPYKVRRFNWINIVWDKPLDLQLNPEVTVRCRGVMEKCTFCVQRIRQAEYRAVRENRKVRDGEVQPACVQSCPAKVYSFGDLLDPDSEVTRLTRSDPRRYHLLEELNTKPAVTYLKRVEIDT